MSERRRLVYTSYQKVKAMTPYLINVTNLNSGLADIVCMK